jgi:trehalose 6-phosphate phosphatase
MAGDHPLGNSSGDLTRELVEVVRAGRPLWLFLDYDGTLAGFADSPALVLPDARLIDLMTRLASHPRRVRLAILSGRRLDQIAELLPIPGIFLAGSYGLEYRNLEGDVFYRLNFDANRPILDQLKPRWEKLIGDREGFFLEDKGWSLALHARFADKPAADAVLGVARQEAASLPGRGAYRILGGRRFLEVAPIVADKGQSVAVLLDQFPLQDGCLVYVGDDDKDEEAFAVVREKGGIPVVVARRQRRTQALYRLPSPFAVRRLLRSLVKALEEPPAPPED